MVLEKKISKGRKVERTIILRIMRMYAEVGGGGGGGSGDGRKNCPGKT